MNKLIRAESIKFRTSRSNWVLLAAGLILSVAIVVVSVALFGNSVGDSEPHVSLLDRANLIGFGSIMALIFISIVGVRVFGNEWRTGTIESAAIAAPIRAELFFAKCILMAIVGFVYGIAVSGDRDARRVHRVERQGLLHRVRRSPGPAHHPRLRRAVRALRPLGVTVGSFFTSNALATALVIAFPAVVEDMAVSGNAGSYLPFAAGNAVLNADPQISALEGGIIFAAFAAALILVGERVFDRRDLT